jgi:hypothetical protein
MINGINPCFCREPPALEWGTLCYILERLDRFITSSHFSTEKSELGCSFYSMMQMYFFRNDVEGTANLRRIDLNILNGVVPLSIGMLLSWFYRGHIVAGFVAMTDFAPNNEINRD